MNDLYDLTGRHAIITGGAGLLGIQHARALLQKKCGVELWDKDFNTLQTGIKALKSEFSKSEITVRKIDITLESEIENAMQNLRENFVKVDILINNAAFNPKFLENSPNSNSHFENYDLNLWNMEISVGLTGAMLCSKHLGSYMSTLGGGVILNIASDLSVISPDQRIYELPGVEDIFQFKKPVSYSVIKSGLIGLTKYLATYWAESGIRANALSPGGVYEGQNSIFVENLVSRIPMGRMAQIEEYLGAIQFLCSDASKYLNGHNLIVDGGRTIW